MGVGYGPVIPTNGMVLNLDGLNTRSYAGSGTAWLDISSVGYNLTLQAAPTYNATNGSFAFNGSTQYAAQTSGVTTYGVAGGLTVLAFVNPTAVNVANAVIAHESTTATNDGWRMVLRGTGFLGFTLGNVADYTSATAAILANVWQHVAITTLSTTLTYFVNGNQYDSATIGAMGGTPATWQVGRDQGGIPEWMSGSINNASVYNRVLSVTEIQQHFNAYRGRYGV